MGLAFWKKEKQVEPVIPRVFKKSKLMEVSNVYEIDKKLINGKGSSLLVIPKFWLQANNYSDNLEVTIIPIANFLLVIKKGDDELKKKIIKALKKIGFLKK